LLKLRSQPHLAVHRIAKQYGDICSIPFGSVPTVVISHPDLLKEAFDKTELADRWVGEVMGILSHYGKDLALAPYGEHWRQLQRFANRELLSLRRLQQIREQHVEEVVNNLVAEVGQGSDAGLLMHPLEMLGRTNAMIMFRAIFGGSEGETGEFARNRNELLELIFWVFRNASAANLTDYVPWLRVFPNSTVNEAKRKVEVRNRILGALIKGARSRPGLDLINPDRFLLQEDGSPAPAASNAFMPFGIGHRACPGRRFGEMVVWLHASRLLHQHQFQAAGADSGLCLKKKCLGWP